MITFKNGKGLLVVVLASLAVLLASCSTSPVLRDGELQGQEGVVAVRVLDLGDVTVNEVFVRSEATGKIHSLQPIRFGQTVTSTFVGRLPAGRYQPKELTGTEGSPGRSTTVTSALERLTGKFEVQAARATQLGTIVHYPMPGSYTNRTIERDYESVDFRAGVALDPTPVPVEAVLLARFPKLAKEVSLEATVGWVSGSMPTQAAGDLDQARALVKPVSPPVLLDATNYLIGGALGVIREQRPDGTSVRHVVNTAQTITAVLPLQDGRWLAGAEQGYLAMSSNRGKDWRALPPIPPDNVILHLIQSQDTQLFMVTARASEIAIYESSDHPIAWQEIKRIPSARVENARFKQFGEHARYRPAFVAASNDRLVVLTAQPDTISSLDFRTRRWESFAVPHFFNAGIKVTPDGFVLGLPQFYLYGSDDYGKTWKELEAGWLHTTQPHFFDRKRGVLLAAEVGMLSQAEDSYRIHTTNDGGLTWQAGESVEGWIARNPPLFWQGSDRRLLRPLWADPSGRVLYTIDSKDRLSISHDGGRTWQEGR